MKRTIRHSLRAAVILMVLVGISLPATLLHSQTTHAQDSDNEIVVVGSRIMEDLVNELAESYRNETESDLALVVDAEGGNRAGYDSFCRGEADITMATTEISDEDIEACKANGVEFVEVLVAYDGLVLAVNEASSVSCVAVERLSNIFVANVEPTWENLDPNFVAPLSESSDEETSTPLTLFGLGAAESERALSILSALLTGTAPRDDYEKLDTLAAIVDTLSDPENNGLAFMTLPQWESLEDTTGLKLLQFNTTSSFECVAPSLASFSTGDYPAMRSLMLYVNAASLLNADLSEFLQFSFGDETLSAEERHAAIIATARGFSAPVQAVLDRDLNNIRGSKVGRTFTRRATPFTISTAAVGDITISGTSISSFATRPLITSFNGIYTQINVNISATADAANAWTAFCGGEVSVIQTNRRPTEAESTACSNAGINPYEVYLGSDAVVFLVKSDAGLPQCVDYSQLAGMLVPIPSEDMSNETADSETDADAETVEEEATAEGDASVDESSTEDDTADESVNDSEDISDDDTTTTDEADDSETDEAPAAPVQQAQGPTNWNELNSDWVELPLIVLVPSLGATETDIILGQAAPSARLRRTDSPTIQETPSAASLDDIVYRFGSVATVEGAVTYVPWSVWQANNDIEGVTLLEISNEAGGIDCVAPTEDSIQDQSYPLGYSSYLYFSEEGLSNELVSALLWHTHSDEGLDAVATLNPLGFDRQALVLGRDDLFTLIEANVPQVEDETSDVPPGIDPSDTPPNGTDTDGESTEPTTEILG